MVGVWDTVGSLGIPSVVGAVDPIAYGVLDTSLSPLVDYAYQALAIDEMRCEFPPTLWAGNPAPGQTLEQVWFTGVHSDVGGGEPDTAAGATALSDITLAWMMSKAAALGLGFYPDTVHQYVFPVDPKWALDTLHSSWNILCGFPRRRSIAANAVLANTVKIRCGFDSAYRPENLAFDNGALAAAYGIDAVATDVAIAVAAGQH